MAASIGRGRNAKRRSHDRTLDPLLHHQTATISLQLNPGRIPQAIMGSRMRYLRSRPTACNQHHGYHPRGRLRPICSEPAVTTRSLCLGLSSIPALRQPCRGGLYTASLLSVAPTVTSPHLAFDVQCCPPSHGDSKGGTGTVQSRASASRAPRRFRWASCGPQ